MKTTLFILSIGLGVTLAADQTVVPEITIDGRKYQNVRVQTVRPNDLILRHELGILRVPLEKLPEPLRAQYYDPAKMAANHAAQQQAAELKQKQQAETARLEAEKRNLLNEVQREREGRVLNGKVLAPSDWETLEGSVANFATNGVVLQLYKTERVTTGPRPRPRVDNLSRIGGSSGRGNIYILPAPSEEVEVPTEKVFVRCGANQTKGLKSRDRISLEATKTGLYDYNHPVVGLQRIDLYDVVERYVSPALQALREKRNPVR